MPAKYRVKFTDSVKRDINEIWDYIAARNPAAASRFVLQIDRQIETLETFPARCAAIPENELLGTKYRHLIHGKYRTIIRISGKTVFVLRAIHGARLLDSSMFTEDRSA